MLISSIKTRCFSRRGLEYGQEGVDAVLNQQSGAKTNIIGVMRAHQHTANAQDEMMQNIAKGNGICNMRGCSHTEGIGNNKEHKRLKKNTNFFIIKLHT